MRQMCTNTFPMLFIFLLFFPSSYSYVKNFKFVISDLKGQATDYNNGVLKNKKSKLSSRLIVMVKGSKVSLDTGLVVLNVGLVKKISGQITFTFQAELAYWVVSCYPSIGFALVNVHSDASKYGGARMLSYSGTCQRVKN